VFPPQGRVRTGLAECSSPRQLRSTYLEQFPGSGKSLVSFKLLLRVRDALHHQAPLFVLRVGNQHLKFIPVGLARFGLNCFDCRLSTARPAQTDHEFRELKFRSDQPGEMRKPALLQAVIQRQSAERRPFLLGIVPR